MCDENKNVGRVSVIVPNYNYARYLKGRVKSILKQTYPIDELIILDDNSTDGSQEIIAGLEKMVRRERPEIKVQTILSCENSGKPMGQWLKGVKAASGDFVWIAEADDVADRNFLKEVMLAFDDPEVVISYAESKVINGLGLTILPNFRKSRDREGTGHFRKSYVRDGTDEIREIMAVRCIIPNVSGAVFRRMPQLEVALGEALKFEQVGDWYFYTKLLEKGKISYNRKSLNKFRVHRGSATKRGKEHYDEMKWMHQYFEKHFELAPEVRERIERENVRIRAKYGIID